MASGRRNPESRDEKRTLKLWRGRIDQTGVFYIFSQHLPHRRSHHGVGLARSGLAVSKQTYVVALGRSGQHRHAQVLEHLRQMKTHPKIPDAQKEAPDACITDDPGAYRQASGIELSSDVQVNSWNVCLLTGTRCTGGLDSVSSHPWS